MDVKYGSDEAKKFVTNLSFITSNGKWGENVMAAEWVHQISYEPGMIMINVHDFDATADNIIESKQFGINVATKELSPFVMIAGHNSGKKVHKVEILKESGLAFYKGKKTGLPMIKGAALNLECKLVKHEKIGDHMMFIGEVVSAESSASDPIVFRAATGLFGLGDKLSHSNDAVAEDKMAQLLEKHKKG